MTVRVPADPLAGTLVLLPAGDLTAAVPVDAVEQIVPVAATVALPATPPWVLGVLDLHGEAVPVVDLQARLGGPASTPDLGARLAIARTPDGAAVALLCGPDIAVVDADPQTLPPGRGPVHADPAVTAVTRVGSRLVLVLDPAVILRAIAGHPAGTTGAEP